MARYRGQKALYEVIGGRARNLPTRPSVEPLKPPAKEKSKTPKPVVTKKQPVVVQKEPEKKPVLSEKEAISWKPRPIQVVNGRVEMTLSVRAVVIVILLLVTVMLICFRAGQMYTYSSQGGTLIDNTNNESPDQSETGLPKLSKTQTASPGPASRQVQQTFEPTLPVQPVDQEPIVTRQTYKAKGGNAVVIQEFERIEDLIEVGKYFTDKGVPTEIVSKNKVFYLISSERFQYNPEAENTAGSILIWTIRELGRDYRAPQGFESFAPNKFKRAYGRKIDDQYIGEVQDVH